jgi:hypothetical protein
MKKLVYLLLFICIVFKLPAQNKVVVEAIRSFSMFGPSMYYLEDTAVQSSIKSKLSVILNKNFKLLLSNETLPIENYTSTEALKNNTIKFNIADTSTWHLFIEVYEYDPISFLTGSALEAPDSAIIAGASSIFQISCILTNGLQEIISNQSVFAAISNTETAGFGIRPKNIFLTKKSFASVVQVGIQMALNPDNETMVADIKTPAVYYADNFMMGHINNTSKILVNTVKDTWGYTVVGNQELLRMGEQLFDEIWVKRKLVDSSASPLLLKKIKETGNTASSDFIYLRQECRDVYQDKNYTIKIATEIDPYSTASSKKELFSDFLSGEVHLMLEGKDTAAIFGINKNIGDANKQVYVDKTTNGMDSSSVAKVSKKDFPFQVTYDYQLTGKIRGERFTIQSFWNHEMKEIYLNNKRIGIVKGKTDPENFIIVNDATNASIMKELLLIAYNKFLL